MMRHDPLPTTEVEAHRRIARWCLGPQALLAAYSGDLRRAAEGVNGSCAGGGEFATVEGRHVRYEYATGLTGTVRVSDLVRLAAASATRGAVDRLTAALAGWAAVHRDEEEQFGPFYARGRDLHRSPEWAAHGDRVQAALRELDAARDAWWDGQPGVQLDLFGAAS